MELYALQVFATVVGERSFSRAAEKLLRTQPAVSLALQRLETELDEKLIDRSAKGLVMTDAGRLMIGANESSTLYLLPHVERYRRLYPKVKVQVRRSQSSKIPSELLDGNLELGVVSYDPTDERIVSKVIYNDALTFVVSPKHRFARRKTVSISELGMETFIAHNVVSPYREVVLREFRRHKVPLNMDVEMPTLESIRKLVQSNEGVAFLPKMCVRQDIEAGTVREVTVKELHVERKVRLLFAKARTLSHAALAFLDVVGEAAGE